MEGEENALSEDHFQRNVLTHIRIYGGVFLRQFLVASDLFLFLFSRTDNAIEFVVLTRLVCFVVNVVIFPILCMQPGKMQLQLVSKMSKQFAPFGFQMSHCQL